MRSQSSLGHTVSKGGNINGDVGKGRGTDEGVGKSNRTASTSIQNDERIPAKDSVDTE